MTTETANDSISKEAKDIRMDDGTVVTFSGKAKMKKEITISDSGEITVRLDFVNGEYRVLAVRQDMVAKFAAHGASQKLGDEIANVKEVEDCVIAIDELIDRLDKGDWKTQRESNSLAGASILQRALIELTGQTKDEVKAFLSPKSQAEKVALRNNPRLQPIVARLEAERDAKNGGKAKKAPPVIDTDSMLDGLAGATSAE